MKFTRKIKEKRGSVLIEAIVGISLVTIGILGIVSFLTNSSRFYNSSVNNLKATYLAAEGIEVVKNIIDTNYVKGGDRWNPPANGWYYLDSGTTADSLSPIPNPPTPSVAQFVKFDSTSGTYGSTGINTIFRRIVNINDAGGYLSVLSYVSWNENGSQKQVLLEDHFYDWRPNI
ncbi:MAG: hypothetical protein ABSF47_01965 [Minisyncoccia bacterium]|jgi:hypothetical protein